MNKHFSEKDDMSRFETFIDAILAIIMTILVLEFRVPERAFASEGELKYFVHELMPSVFSYVISFATIVILWMDHHYMFRKIQRANTAFILLNFVFILFLSATPFTTALAGKNPHSAFAVALVATNYAFMNLCFTILWAYAYRKEIIPENVVKAKSVKFDAFTGISGVLLLIAAIPLAYVNTFIPFALFIIVIIMHLAKQLYH